MNFKAHVVTATPTYTGDVVFDYANALTLAGMHCLQKGIVLDPRGAPGFSLVEYARNWLVAEFLSIKTATHLMWIDADLFFEPTAIARLVSHNKDFVCGVYTTKNEQNPTYPYTALGPVTDGLQEAERVPGGFICVKRHVVERVSGECEWHEIEHNGATRMAPRFFDLRLDGKHLVGEDFIAGERIRRAGFKLWVDPDVRFIHYGRKGWPAHLATTLKAEAMSGFLGQGTEEAWKKNAANESTDHNSGVSEDRSCSGRESAESNSNC